MSGRRRVLWLLPFPLGVFLSVALLIAFPASRLLLDLASVSVFLGLTGFGFVDSRLDAAERRERAAVPPPARQELADEYGPPSVTEIRKDARLPTAGELAAMREHLKGTLGKPPSAIVRTKEEAFTRDMRKNFEPAAGSSTQADREMLRRARDPGPSQQAQAALSADLLAYLEDQAEEYGAPGCHWEMNAAWLAEVQKVQLPSGGPLFKPRLRSSQWQSDGYLLGYPVRVSDASGAPDLVPGTGAP